MNSPQTCDSPSFPSDQQRIGIKWSSAAVKELQSGGYMGIVNDSAGIGLSLRDC